MSYTEKLIGRISPEQENLEIKIGSNHLFNLELLAQDYGKVGRGFEIILQNPLIDNALRTNGIGGLVINEQGVKGLDALGEPERNVLAHLLNNQYQRSLPIFDKAKSGELEQYDNVSLGVVKGGLVGLLTAFMGFGTRRLLNRIGLGGPMPEMMARMGPATLESSGISHEVKKELTSKPGLEKIISVIKELPQDTAAIVKRMPHGFYEGVNIYGWIDKLRGIKIDQTYSTNTQQWAASQESGPYRGLMGLTIIKSADPYLRPIFENYSQVVRSLYDVLHYILESIAVFWVNTGNNVQGIIGVYEKLKQELNSRLKAIEKTVLDPFQLANILVCSAWLGTELYLRSEGFKLEEYLGEFGAALESFLLSLDTAAAGQAAKPLASAILYIPALFSVTNRKLLKLARQYDSSYFIDSINHSKRGLWSYFSRSTNRN